MGEGEATGSQRGGILACIQRELPVCRIWRFGPMERTTPRRSCAHSSFGARSSPFSRRLNRTSLVFAKSTQFRGWWPPRLSCPFSVVTYNPWDPSGIHPRTSRLLILISSGEHFLFWRVPIYFPLFLLLSFLFSLSSILLDHLFPSFFFCSLRDGGFEWSR